MPWESSKDSPFASSGTYIGFVWDLDARSVSLTDKKMALYLAAIENWLCEPAHALDTVRKLYGKLLHSSLLVPAGRAYLTGLETMLGSFGDSPLARRHPPRSVRPDLEWWAALFRAGPLSRPIPVPKQLVNVGAFSDASSGVGIAIVVGRHWRAWRLLPGWTTLNGDRDIGWAEAVGFELLVYAVAAANPATCSFQVFGDNKGVVEGWWNHRSRNTAVNTVFKRVHAFLSSSNRTDTFYAAYVPSALNPADKPSRGIYPSASLLLPPVPIPDVLSDYIVDWDAPLTSKELRARRDGVLPKPAPKCLSADRCDPQFHERPILDDIGFVPFVGDGGFGFEHV